MSKFVIDTFVDVVNQVNNRYSMDVYSMYGHRKEINRRLLEKDKDSVYKYQKYPLIALNMPFSENIEQDDVIVTSLNIAIMDHTDTTYISEERYQQVFVPILEPIYDLFVDELKKHPNIMGTGTHQHTRIDRLFWSTTNAKEERPFSDPLDAIEIINLELRLLKNNC